MRMCVMSVQMHAIHWQHTPLRLARQQERELSAVTAVPHFEALAWQLLHVERGAKRCRHILV